MTQNFHQFNNSFTTYLYEQIPIGHLKITRDDYKVIKILLDQRDFKFPTNLKIGKYIDSIRVKIYQLLIEDRSSYLENQTKSYIITSSKNGIFNINGIKGNQLLQKCKERVVQV